MKQFNNLFLHTTKIILAASALALFVAALASLGGFSADPARAATGGGVSGFAWSDNIGWISFSCTTGGTNGGDICSTSNYGVNIDAATGAFSGYAWSDAIGWINFTPDASGAPENPKTAARVDFLAAGNLKPVTGWARACAVFANGCSGALKNAPDGSDIYRGGWDGWLKMHDVMLDTAATPNTFGGYAWGGDTVGWISMSGASPNYAVIYGGAVSSPVPLAVTLLPATQNVVVGGSASISWEVKNLAGKVCVAEPLGWWNGTSPIPDDNEIGVVTFSPFTAAMARTYSLECTDVPRQSASISISPFISSFTANGYPSATYVEGGPSVMLAWDTANVTSGTCLIDNGVGSVPLSGSTPVTPNTETTYELSCTGSPAFSNSPQEVTVHYLPAGFTLEPPRHEIKITTIGEGGVGTGGVSDKAVFHVIADNAVSTVALTVTQDPFSAVPASYNLIRGTNYFYKFRIVPTADNASGVASSIFDTLTVTVDDAHFWDDKYEIEFWVESTVPLPPLSQNHIRVHGASGAATADVDINLDSRAFNPEYREI